MTSEFYQFGPKNDINLIGMPNRLREISKRAHDR